MNFFQEKVTELSRQLYAAEDLTERIVTAKRYIDDWYFEPIDIKALARASCLSRFHFIRVFNKHYGQTPGQYLRHVRVKEARRLIADGMPAREASLQVGYSSITSFHTLYKYLTGLTPGNTRKTISQNESR